MVKAREVSAGKERNGSKSHIVTQMRQAPLTTSPRGNHYLHVLVDIHSRFVLLQAIPDKRMTTIAATWRDIFCTFGFPRTIQSDNGSEFVNKIINTMTKESGIEHRLITPYHPRANGIAERTVQTTTRLIKKLIKGAKKNWDAYVPFAQYCVNQKIVRRHQHAPFSVMFGRKANAFADFSATPMPEELALTGDEHQSLIREMEQRIATMCDKLFPLVALQSEQQATSTKVKFDKTHPLIVLPLDTLVMVRDHHRHSKMDPANEGPFKIVGKNRGGAYVLQDLTGKLLAHNYQPSALISLSTNPQFPQDSFVVESVLDHQETATGYTYLVRWKGYKEEHDTWEPENNFDDLGAIHHYWHRRGQTTTGGK
jgi:hypothetical protein